MQRPKSALAYSHKHEKFNEELEKISSKQRFGLFSSPLGLEVGDDYYAQKEF